MAAVMICDRCGFRMGDAANYCGRCGQKFPPHKVEPRGPEEKKDDNEWLKTLGGKCSTLHHQFLLVAAEARGLKSAFCSTCGADLKERSKLIKSLKRHRKQGKFPNDELLKRWLKYAKR